MPIRRSKSRRRSRRRSRSRRSAKSKKRRRSKSRTRSKSKRIGYFANKNNQRIWKKMAHPKHWPFYLALIGGVTYFNLHMQRERVRKRCVSAFNKKFAPIQKHEPYSLYAIRWVEYKSVKDYLSVQGKELARRKYLLMAECTNTLTKEERKEYELVMDPIEKHYENVVKIVNAEITTGGGVADLEVNDMAIAKRYEEVSRSKNR